MASIDHKNLICYKRHIVDWFDRNFQRQDYVFHLAAIPSVKKCEDPFNSNKLNVTGTLTVLIAQEMLS
jgi:nucleoside-diphosphate-sugar epimerase